MGDIWAPSSTHYIQSVSSILCPSSHNTVFLLKQIPHVTENQHTANVFPLQFRVADLSIHLKKHLMWAYEFFLQCAVHTVYFCIGVCVTAYRCETWTFKTWQYSDRMTACLPVWSSVTLPGKWNHCTDWCLLVLYGNAQSDLHLQYLQAANVKWKKSTCFLDMERLLLSQLLWEYTDTHSGCEEWAVTHPSGVQRPVILNVWGIWDS